MEHHVTLLMSEFVTHDVKRFVVSRPDSFSFTPGQGVELAIDVPAWRGQGRPFTPTSLVADRVLEFTIKAYPQHNGVTRELHGLKPGSGLLMSAPFGTIQHRGAGTFIAGGAGITPFIAILRELDRTQALAGHGLIFSNRTPADIICEKELRHYLGNRCRLLCTDAAAVGYEHRRIDAAYLQEAIDDFGQQFYVCGPPGFMDAVTAALKHLGADPQALVFEQ
jgi:ferredoxin-NADP reductase